MSDCVNRVMRSLGGAAFLLPLLLQTGEAAVEIGAGKTKNMSCSSGVCAPTAKKAVLNADHLAHLLNASDIKIVTGSGAVTIEVTSALGWASSHRLTLDANLNVSIKAPVTVTGAGGLTIVTNDGGSGGDLLFFPGGKIDFWDLSSSLVVNGDSYTLVSDIDTLAHDIGNQPSGSYAFVKDYQSQTTYQSPPIGGFSGALLGLNHTISNLTVLADHKTGAAAMFGATSGTIRDITLANVDIRANKSNAAGLVLSNDGILQNVRVTGTIANTNRYGRVGGLASTNLSDGLIVRSLVSASVSAPGESFAGGLVGWNDGTIVASTAAGSAKSAGNPICHFPVTATGGPAGYNDGTISQSSSSNAVNGGIGNLNECGEFLTLAGGIAGLNLGLVDRSYATGSAIVDYGYVGGLIGENSGSVTNSYSLAAVTEDYGTGGLIGHNKGSIGETYSAGPIALSGNGLTGGLVGYDEAPSGSIADGYWDLDTSNIANPSQGAGYPPNDPGIAGLTDVQLKSGLPGGFDPAVWGQNPNINSGYPYLLANPPN